MTKRLVVAEQWDSFARAVLPANVSPVQRQEMRRAFYGGAQGLLYSILKLLTPGVEPSEDDMRMMSGIERELSDFADQVKAGRA